MIENVRIVPDALDPAMGALRDIYMCAFPESERKPVELLYEMIDRSDYRFVVIEEHGITIGFAILFTPMDLDNAALLEYLAIDSTHQGSGAGTTLVQFIIQLIGKRPLLVEVESDSDVLSQRRKTFYRRIGFRRLCGLDFILPLPNSPAMELMVVNGHSALSGETVGRWMKLIYREVYSCNEDDFRLQKMTGGLPARVLLE